MRLVVQRVKNAKVVDAGSKEVFGQISGGVFVLLGVEKGDALSDAKNFAQKLLNIRIMSNEHQKMGVSIFDTKAEILVVSQFTLLANTSKGNRPSFLDAARSVEAKWVYQAFVEELDKSGLRVQTGEFGAYMEIVTTLDGPVTILF